MGRGRIWGGDHDDPRLFYFRALLEGGRFFGGGKRSSASAKEEVGVGND
jgi:hypothetical protein